MANFSPQQYLELLQDSTLSDEVKTYLSRRVAELIAEYRATPNASLVDPAIAALAEHTASPTLWSGVKNGALAPYYAVSRQLYDMKDKVSVRGILEEGEDFPVPGELPAIDWAAEEKAAVAQGKAMSGNNDFWMLDDYYTTYIGSSARRTGTRTLPTPGPRSTTTCGCSLPSAGRRGLSRCLSMCPSMALGAITLALRRTAGRSITKTSGRLPGNTALRPWTSPAASTKNTLCVT